MADFDLDADDLELSVYHVKPGEHIERIDGAHLEALRRDRRLETLAHLDARTLGLEIARKGRVFNPQE
jgi:hypothetical protein